MNNFYSGNITPDYFIRKEGERRELKKLGSLCAIAICAYVLVQNILVLLLHPLGLLDNYQNNSFFQCGVDIIITFAGILLPFAVINIFMKKHSGVKETCVFERKVSVPNIFLAVVSGTGLCMAANIIASVFIAIFAIFGMKLTSPDIPMPMGVSGMLLSFVRVVVVAAMTEEIALRGIVMGNLRKYGDAFAIGTAALVFALMHGNLVQSPFALIAGFTIGYFTLKTGTLWTGILIHGMNNFISLVISYIIKYMGDETGNLIYYFLIFTLSAAGIFGFIIFFINNKADKLGKSRSVMSLSEKLSAYLFNFPMIVAFMIMIFITTNFIEFGW